MWCAIVVNRGLTTREKRSEQTECTMCTVQSVWWKKSESGVKRAKWRMCHSTLSLGDRSDDQNMYVLSVRIDEWAQGGMRSMVHGCMWGFTHQNPKVKTSQDKAGKSPGKSSERFSVATCAPVEWASSWRWRAGNHGACPHAWGPCMVPSCR